MLWNSSAQLEELERGKSCNGREGGGPWGSPEETSCRGFLGNVDFVDKIYGGNVGEYLPSKITLSHSLPKVSLISSKLKPVRSFLHSGFTLSIAITTC